MDKNFIRWFTRLIVAADIVLLLASTPHIAAWFEHNDDPHTWLESAYAWIIGYGIALAIDGTALALLYGLIGLFHSKVKAPGKKAGLIAGLIFLACLSTYINTLYDIQNATTAFAKADAVQVFGMPLGNINPFIGGSFALLNIFYAVLSSIVQSDVKAEITDEKFEAEKRRIRREQELKSLRKGKGLIARAKETALEVKMAAKEVMKEESKQQSSFYGKTQLDSREARSSATTPNNGEPQENDSSATERDTDKLNGVPRPGDKNETEMRSQNSPLDGLSGRATVSIEEAAKIIGCEIKYVRTLRNRGKLKATPRNNDLLTIASIKSYLESRKKSNRETQPASNNGHNGHQNGHKTDEIKVLELKRLEV